ncbi:MAG: bis(5'-nucleosyl)-tetraphosphatase (symmetrical) YqeK [Lachnospiraceae bacterium]|nr:bis(5'-nucleosyl)-tetraphosphatase (symmetrical) YqeK [Lachnospiraceae bacterium]
MDRIKMREQLERKLTKKRYEHSMGVSYTAAAMAMVYGLDTEKAAVAGLLHDCAKCYSSEEKLKRCKKHNLPISSYEQKNPELLHAKLSAYYAREKYGVEDEEILSAITWHTTGKADMSTLDKIIYIADFIEPNRKMLPEMEEIRKEAFLDLDRCLIHILTNMIRYLSRKDAGSIDPLTLETYEYYVKGK